MKSILDSNTCTAVRVKTLSVAELLVLHAEIGEELRERGVVRSANNPTGDLAEYLFAAPSDGNKRRTPNVDMMQLDRMARGIKLRGGAFIGAINPANYPQYAT